MSSSDVARTEPILSDEDRAEIKSFDDALALLARAGVTVTPSTELGDGFVEMDKAELVNVPFIVTDMRIIPAEKSDYDSDYAFVRVVTQDGRKGFFTDGSPHGVCKQVQSAINRGVSSGMYCEKGLVRSDYDFVDEAGKKRPATTYYFYGM